MMGVEVDDHRMDDCKIWKLQSYGAKRFKLNKITGSTSTKRKIRIVVWEITKCCQSICIA